MHNIQNVHFRTVTVVKEEDGSNGPSQNNDNANMFETSFPCVVLRDARLEAADSGVAPAPIVPLMRLSISISSSP